MFFLTESDSKLLQTVIKVVTKDEDILSLLIYGSSLKTQQYHDIDLVLVKTPGAPDKKLRYLLQFPEIFDVHFLADLPIYIANEAIKGEILINKDSQSLFDIYIKIIEEWRSFQPYHQLFLECVKYGL